MAAIDFNHQGRSALAARLVELARDAGADAVKFSLRRPSAAGLDATQAGAEEPGVGRGRAASSLPVARLASARRLARGHLRFVVAPHHEEDIARARRLDPDAYQVDPPALANARLLRALGQAGRPVLVVAAACTDSEIATALGHLRGVEVTLLHAVAAPGLTGARTRLGLIPWLKTRFRRPVGYLGFEPGICWALVAAALGAQVVEKPFSVDETMAGPGASGAPLGPGQLRALVTALSDLPAAIGRVRGRHVLPEELDLLASTESIVARRQLKRGHPLRLADLAFESPLRGLSARQLDWLIGRRLRYDLNAGEPLTFGLVE